MNFIQLGLVSIALLLPWGTFGASPIDIAKVLRLADDARAPREDYSTVIQVSDFDAGDERKSAYKLSVKGSSLCLVEQLEPVRLAGRKLLMHDYDLWLYTPSVSRPTRISFEQKLSGEVANGDLMRTNFADDYTGNFLGNEFVDGVQTIKIHLQAKTKEVTYRSIDYWVDSKKFQPTQAIFYAASGKPMKIATYHDFKLQLGKVRLSKVVIKDLLQKNRSSQITYLKYKKEKFAPSLFSKESLGQ